MNWLVLLCCLVAFRLVIGKNAWKVLLLTSLACAFLSLRLVAGILRSIRSS